MSVTLESIVAETACPLCDAKPGDPCTYPIHSASDRPHLARLTAHLDRTTLTFDVYGLPAPQGSKRHVGNGVMVESSKNVKPWREAVKHAALDTQARFGKQPVAVWLIFYLPRPKGHFRTGKRANELRPGAGAWPMTRPDVDKLVRSTCDALKDAGVYHDDACIAVLDASKTYADNRPPGANVTVKPLGGTP